MLDKEKLKQLIRKTNSTTQNSSAKKCAHHWIMNSSEAVPLRGRQALQNPDCIGRKSTCKLCGKTQIKPERVF